MTHVSKKALPRAADTGVIHGRFQILHNDHLKYLLAGKERCRTLVVGITNPDPMLTRKEKSAPMRDDPIANPLTYYERQVLVRAALKECGTAQNEISVVPFPISFPDLYKHYVPMDAVFFLTIYDDWGRKKRDTFQAMGLNTHVLWELPIVEKGISATDIRTRMIDSDPWTHLVPRSVASLLEEWNIPGRLRRIMDRE